MPHTEARGWPGLGLPSLARRGPRPGDGLPGVGAFGLPVHGVGARGMRSHRGQRARGDAAIVGGEAG
jgi:hypothetical protein